jgi:CubicO group peptidase (beta-lactamase class C family)
MRSLLALLLAGAVVSGSAQSTPAIHRLDGKTVSQDEAILTSFHELVKDHVTGAQIAILNRGKVVWTYAYGFRDAEHKLPMTTDTNIWAASITKPVFATWVMHLVERHQFDLDKPIAQILPRPLNTYEPYKVSGAEIVRDPQWQRVTPRTLLAHTSGLANFADLEPDKKLHLHFAPGSRFAYSGEGLNLLQFAIEETQGSSISAGMQHDLFAPLGMRHTGMVWRPEFDADAALRYDAKGGLIGATHRDRARGAGSMTTTIDDLGRFTEAFLGSKILAPATRAQMLTSQVNIRAAHQFPTLDTATSEEGAKVGLAYGLGWGLLAKTPYGEAFFKEGHGDGAENYMICFIRNSTCMILLTNSDNGELAFRPLLEQLLGDTVTPWEWEGYTSEAILANSEHSAANQHGPAK